MMSEILHKFEFPYLEVTVDIDRPDAGIKTILETVKPEWEFNNVVIKKLTGGRLNQMYCCRLEEDTHCTSGVIIRCYGNLFQEFITRDNEVFGIHVNYVSGCGVPFLARFTNGMVLGFAAGEQVRRKDLGDPAVIKGFSAGLARIHSTDPETILIQDTRGHQYKAKINMDFWTNEFRKAIINNLPDDMTVPEEYKHILDRIPSKAELSAESDFIDEWLQKSNIPFGPGHVDCNGNNLLYHKETGKLTLVDSEMYGGCYQPGEFTSLLTERDFNIIIGNWTENDPAVDDVTVEKYARCYLETRAKIKGGMESEVTDKDVKNFLKMIHQMTVINEFNTGFFMLSENPEGHKFNTVIAGLYGLRHYFAGKHLLQ